MDWQDVIAWFAIALAGVYLLMRGLRAWRSTKGGCSGGCGCVKATTDAQVKAQPTIIAPEQLVLRQRPPRADE